MGNIFYMGMILQLYERKKYKTVCAVFAFAKVTFDRMVMIFVYRIYNFCFICYAIFKEGTS